jgi:hypothetical protein
VPWLPRVRKTPRSREEHTAIRALLHLGGGVQDPTHPTAWVGKCSRLASLHGTQKPEK